MRFTVSKDKDDAPRAGDRMPDGTVYAGVSPTTGKPLYALPGDAGQALTWGRAMDYAAGLEAHGYRDWRMPSQSELDLLWRKRYAIGGFSMTGWYWSSSISNFGPVWVQRFSDGHQFSYAHKSEGLLVRCVRS